MFPCSSHHVIRPPNPFILSWLYSDTGALLIEFYPLSTSTSNLTNALRSSTCSTLSLALFSGLTDVLIRTAINRCGMLWHFDTSRNVAGSVPEEVVEFSSIYLITPTALASMLIQLAKKNTGRERLSTARAWGWQPHRHLWADCLGNAQTCKTRFTRRWLWRMPSSGL
jgi:hypothetical protein